MRVRKGNILQYQMCLTCAMKLCRKSQPEDTERTCNACHLVKPVSEFGTGSQTNKCKECRKARRKILANNYAQELKDNPTDRFRICSICGQNKHESEFMTNIDHRTKCKECHKNNVSKWRAENPEAVKAITKRAYDETYTYVFELKKNNPCEICGQFYHPCQMDYDHLDRSTKRDQIAKLYSNGLQAVKDEIAKCRLICANCHRNETKKTEHLTPKINDYKPMLKLEPDYIDEPLIPGQPSKTCTICITEKPLSSFDTIQHRYKQSYCKHCMFYYRKDWRATNKESISEKDRQRNREMNDVIDSTKDHKTCVDCKKEFEYWILDYDHRPDTDKIFNVSKMRAGFRDIDIILAEIAKCDLVCTNCHRLRTWNRQHSSEISSP